MANTEISHAFALIGKDYLSIYFSFNPGSPWAEPPNSIDPVIELFFHEAGAAVANFRRYFDKAPPAFRKMPAPVSIAAGVVSSNRSVNVHASFFKRKREFLFNFGNHIRVRCFCCNGVVDIVTFVCKFIVTYIVIIVISTTGRCQSKNENSCQANYFI